MDAGKSGYSQVWIPGTDTENRFIERRNEYTVFALSRCFIQVQYMLVVVLYSYIRIVTQFGLHIHFALAQHCDIDT